MENKIRAYLRKSYSRVLIPDPETGRYAAQILEFPGCFSEGKTPTQAYKNLEQAAYNWLESAIKQDMEIPEPFSTEGYSGNVALRMPKTLHRQAMAIAKREGVSLNKLIVASVASWVGADNICEKMADRLEARINMALGAGKTAMFVSAATSPSVVMANSTIGAVEWLTSKHIELQLVGASSLESEILSKAVGGRVQ
jgi:antitoxin HicB